MVPFRFTGFFGRHDSSHGEKDKNVIKENEKVCFISIPFPLSIYSFRSLTLHSSALCSLHPRIRITLPNPNHANSSIQTYLPPLNQLPPHLRNRKKWQTQHYLHPLYLITIDLIHLPLKLNWRVIIFLINNFVYY
jgi:hypothetical protein